jgi:pilus assembly protein CpaE
MRTIVFLGSDALLYGRIQAAADGLANVMMLPAAPASFTQAIAEIAPTLVLLELEGEHDPKFLVDSFAALAAIDVNFTIVVIGNAQNAGDVLAAVRAGSADFIDREEALGALRDRLARRLTILTAVDRDVPNTYSVVFNAQPGGGSGVFALNLAMTRARRSGEALFIDCELPASEAGAALNIALTYSLADAVRDVDRLDRTLLLSAMARHDASGLRVLPLSLHADANNGLSSESFLKVLRAIRPLFTETILNAADIREPILLNTLSQWASTIYVVCPQKFTALSDTKTLLKTLPADAARRIVLVVDEYNPVITLSPAQMLAALGLDDVISLPASRTELINGLNFGRPYILAKPGTPYALAIRAAAGDQIAVVAKSSRSLFQLLMGRLKGRPV